jgi:hypothetical protein
MQWYDADNDFMRKEIIFPIYINIAYHIYVY